VVAAAEEVLIAGYAALTRRDLEGFLGLLHTDAELHELAEIPDTAVYRGHDEIRTWATNAMTLTADWEWTPEEISAAAGDTVLVRVRFSARGRGSEVPIEQLVFHVIEVRDGKLATVRGFLNEAQAREAAGLPT
jgi:ketosteroid isomerase-like protein